jgi:hypothetical protein
MAPQDFNTYQSLIDLFIDFFSGLLPEQTADIEKVKQLPIFQQLPIGFINYVKGKKDNIFRVLKIQTETISPADLMPSAAYPKSDLVETFVSALTAASKKTK